MRVSRAHMPALRLLSSCAAMLALWVVSSTACKEGLVSRSAVGKTAYLWQVKCGSHRVLGRLHRHFVKSN